MLIIDMVRKINAMTGFTHAAGVEVTIAEQGLVEMTLEKKPELLQFNGFFHGGVIAGLADHAAGAAATTSLPPGKIAVTIDLHINYLAPAKGPLLVAKAQCVQTGSTICVVSVALSSVADQQATPCAMATVTLRVVDMPPLA